MGRLTTRSASRIMMVATSFIMFIITALPGGAAQPAATAGTVDDSVVEWNLHASDALINQPTAPVPGIGQAPQVSIVHMAIVQTAVYDAVNMIDGGHDPYLVGLPAAPRSASTAAAAATAAHRVLVGFMNGPDRLLPQAVVDRLDSLYAASIAEATANEGAPSVDDGVEAGEAAATAMLAQRADDGRYPATPSAFPVGDGIGEWRPVPPSFVNDPFAWIADVTPFTVDSSSQFRSKGPHPLRSGAYVREYNEVKALGGDGVATPASRTPEQDAVAAFYLVHPIEMFNRTFRTIAEAEALDVAEQARLFAMLNMAAADAQITCWDDKEYWSFWRPITAIQEGEADANDRTVGDETWTPLIGTPPYPEHPSGYNCVTAAFMHTAARFFGGQSMEFSVVKRMPGVPDVSRDYQHFRDVVADTIDARVFQGIHFRASDVQGARIGQQVARWLDQHEFRSTH